MLGHSELIAIISGKRTGLFPAVVRCCLGCLTPIYRLGIFWHNRKFDAATTIDSRSAVQRVGVPVISIGNLTTGGTGKTPLVLWVANFLLDSSRVVVLISRGYGASPNDDDPRPNDEALELEHRLPNVPHLQAPDRLAMAQIAVQQHQAQVIVLDDAFQHRKIHRDLDVVLIDATLPWGYGRLLPRGLLREPLPNLKRADRVIVTRCNQVDASELEELLTTIQDVAGEIPIAQTRTVATRLLRFDGTPESLGALEGVPVYVFCGIGNPENFRRTLKQLKVKISGLRVFPDHHPFSDVDRQQIESAAIISGAAVIVCTHKDLVKIGIQQFGTLPVFALLIETEFIAGQSEFEAQIDQLIVG